MNISENDEVFLYCTVIGDHINWKANDTPVKDFVALEFDDNDLPRIINKSSNVRIARLKIQGSSHTNETNVTCHVAQWHQKEMRLTTAASDPALIRVQGTIEI